MRQARNNCALPAASSVHQSAKNRAGFLRPRKTTTKTRDSNLEVNAGLEQMYQNSIGSRAFFCRNRTFTHDQLDRNQIQRFSIVFAINQPFQSAPAEQFLVDPNGG
jgi:hypothetical protein